MQNAESLQALLIFQTSPIISNTDLAILNLQNIGNEFNQKIFSPRYTVPCSYNKGSSEGHSKKQTLTAIKQASTQILADGHSLLHFPCRHDVSRDRQQPPGLHLCICARQNAGTVDPHEQNYKQTQSEAIASLFWTQHSKSNGHPPSTILYAWQPFWPIPFPRWIGPSGSPLYSSLWHFSPAPGSFCPHLQPKQRLQQKPLNSSTFCDSKKDIPGTAT